ncbi:hypothetical protein ANCDUO_15952 [Ancylostoma duodenale]|uniref:Uncharacterized protein n=1 Tax=Ancylostoma duodenale TaxID=51022 RepID=A0A0C2FZ83_9BILA|nr:hypothetical protein ANCDUO_15952 [Ancylostoma duodenale]
MNSCLVVTLLLLCSAALSECGCYENWSRCTPQTAVSCFRHVLFKFFFRAGICLMDGPLLDAKHCFLTGILWRNCPDYCRQCKGRDRGNCVKVFNKQCSGGYQCWLVICRCSGRSVPKSKVPIVVATCKLGL